MRLRDGDLTLRPLADLATTGVARFAAERAGTPVAAVELVHTDTGAARLAWTMGDPTDHALAVRVLRLAVGHAFTDHGVHRVETYLTADGTDALRAAARAGLRREGVVRGGVAGTGEGNDVVLLARLADDPDPGSPRGFRAVLNAGLPTKRVIAQGVLRDPAGRVLLCELTYKSDWDLPGGVVERGESPRDCLEREVVEELGLSLPVGELITVDWLPPWAGWDDACLLMFDLGRCAADVVDQMTLEPREIRSVHWADAATVRGRCRTQVADRLELVAGAEPVPPFLHSGRPPRS